MIILLLCLAIVLFAVFKVAQIALQHHKYSHIPGPKRESFFFGNGNLLRRGMQRTGNLGQVFHELMLEFGDVYVYWRITRPIVMVSDLDAVKEITTNIKLFPKRPQSSVAMVGSSRFMGFHSILTDKGGPIWERKKRLMDPAFKISRLQMHIPKLYAIGEKMAEHFERVQGEEGVINFKEVVGPYTMHAISSAGFSVTDPSLLEELCKSEKGIGQYFVSMFSLSPLRSLKIAQVLGFGSPELADAMAHVKYIRDQGKKLILTRLTDGTFGSVNDTLDFIITANQNDEGNVEIEECLDDFITMYEAGNATTSTTLGFTIAELVRNPHCLARLHAEVDAVWSGREVSRTSLNEEVVAALRDMPYLEAVLNETLRRHSPVVVMTRVRAGPWQVQGVHIPAKTWVSVSQHIQHHHAEHWEDPHTFNPERFLDGSNIVPFTFMPFLAGPRRCLGKNFAMLEMKIFLAVWLSRLTFLKPGGEETREGDEIQTHQGVLVSMKNNRVVVRQRATPPHPLKS